MEKTKIAVIGAGHMAKHLIEGLLLKGVEPQSIVATRRTAKPLEKLAKEYGVCVSQDNISAINTANIVFLSAKPTDIKQIVLPLLPLIKKNKPIIISLAVGLRIEKIKEWLQGYPLIVRAMPNLPVKISEGVIGLCAQETFPNDKKDSVNQLMHLLGRVFWLDAEEQVDRLAAISGSGPAYFFYFMASLQYAALQVGFDEELARELVTQTALGSAKMAASEALSLSALCESVAPKGGTTEQALGVFSEKKMTDILLEGVLLAEKRAKNLDKLISGEDEEEKE